MQSVYLASVKILGLMSGTSLDGLDMALCEFHRDGGQWDYFLIKADTVPYDEEMKCWIRRAYALPVDRLAPLDSDFAEWMAMQVRRFLSDNRLKADLIASHGHTIYHQPEHGLTYQLGNGQVLATKSGIDVVCDFRRQDVLLGGQGAPLVPVGDALLFGAYRYCLNLGGIANISLDTAEGERQAYDICPANMILDDLAGRIGLPYDKDGEIAASGSFLPQLYAELNSIDYYETTGPKSLSREWVEAQIKPILASSKARIEDLMHTFCRHIAKQVSNGLKDAAKDDRLLVSGGGTYNKFLMGCIEKESKIPICIPNDAIISYKEAIIFAFLGLLRVRNMDNCWASVTGAQSNCSGGVIFYPLVNGG